MSRKIAIVSCYFFPNYGSMLQAYATQEILDSLGVENRTIDVDGIMPILDARKKKYYSKKIFSPSVIKDKSGFIRKKLHTIIDRDLSNKLKIRRNEQMKFSKEMFRLTKRCSSFAELSYMCSEFSDVLVGSDQLWLPSNIAADYYTLGFVPEGVNRISYATSFGVSSIPESQQDSTVEFLSKFQNLSVREKSGMRIIKQLTGKTVPVVCDPTLLFDRTGWEPVSELPSNRPFIDGDYIFCYFLGSNPLHRKFARRLSEKTGYKIVTLKFCDIYVPGDKSFGDEAPYNVGPKEFLNLIKNAKYICTDSFHGSVFSIQFGKEFFSFRRYSNKSVRSTNSRLDSLFEMCGISGRIFNGDESIDEALNRTIDYDEVYSHLNEARKFSLEYLKNSLGI